MEKEKFKITIIDFMPEFRKHKAGEDKFGNPVHYGDMVEYNHEKNWFVGYRYGQPMLKQVGMMAMIVPKDFSCVEVLPVFGAGMDNLIIGYTDEPFYQQVKHLIEA